MLVPLRRRHKIHIDSTVISPRPPYKEHGCLMSIRTTQFSDDSSVRVCHRESACRKIATRSLQLNTKMKKRTPPALVGSCRQTHCLPSVSIEAPYFLRRVYPITPHFSATARAPDNRRENMSINIETGKQTQIAAPLSYPLTLCHACNSDQNKSARERQKILESEPNFCYFLATHVLNLFYFGFALLRPNSISCGITDWWIIPRFYLLLGGSIVGQNPRRSLAVLPFFVPFGTKIWMLGAPQLAVGWFTFMLCRTSHRGLFVVPRGSSDPPEQYQLRQPGAPQLAVGKSVYSTKSRMV